MNWIKVEDKKPEGYKHVLLFDVTNEMHVGFYSTVQQRFNQLLSEHIITGITHWQPLPEPPKP